MDVSEEAVRAPSGNCGSLRKPRGSGKQEEEQGADCNSPSYTFHRSPAAAVVGRKLLLNSTGNILIHSFLTGSFFAKAARVRLIGIFFTSLNFPSPPHKSNCEGGKFISRLVDIPPTSDRISSRVFRFTLRV